MRRIEIILHYEDTKAVVSLNSDMIAEDLSTRQIKTIEVLVEEPPTKPRMRTVLLSEVTT